jgi:outer membrane immunogenic protein
MKLTTINLSLLAMSSSLAFAGTMGPVVIEPTMKEGFYAGAGIGGGMYNDKILGLNTSNFVQVEKSFNNNSALASVFAGVGKTYFDKYYLGAEANSYFPSHRVIWQDRPGVSVTQYTYEDQFQVQNYVNLDLLPGYRIKPEWLVYGRVGISFSNIVLNQEPNTAADVSMYSSNMTSTGARYGAGLAYQITQHVGAGVDYYYAYNPTSKHFFNDKNTSIEITSHMNYVGFSLFYTV